nr:helix-turn-helix transcriptional regulator [Faecalicoccus acidiformans]
MFIIIKKGGVLVANIGERIRKIRLLRNMMQGELTVAIGFEDNDYGRGRVLKYERGIRVPKEDMLIKISKALNINSYYLSQEDNTYALDLAYELFDWDDVLPFKFKKDENVVGFNLISNISVTLLMNG